MKRLFTLLCFFVFVGSLFAQQIEKQKLDRNGYPAFVKFDTKTKAYSKAETKDVLTNIFELSKNDEYKSFRSEKDQIGYTHERFQQYYKGIKVENGVYIVHSRNNAIESLSGEYKLIDEINTTPTLTEETAIEKAKAFVNAEQYMNANNAFEIAAPELVIVTHKYGKHPKDVHEMVLAYKVDIYALKPLSRDYIYVHAHTGEIVHVNALIKKAQATGSAVTRYSGTKTISTDSYSSYYRLRDYSRGNGIITYDCNTSTSYNNAVDFTDNDNNWTASEYNNSAKDNGALDAHWAAMVTYDYFKDVHGRNSFNGSGALMKTYVHYDVNYDNAFWNGSVFTFGDGNQFDILTSLDVFAHEFGHAVCSYTADLTYQNEEGALNEAFSDIWGCAIERRYAPEKDNWLMGEDLGSALRSISNPKSKGLPDTYNGQYWAPLSSNPNQNNDYGGVHTNNGPFCYWFYLISVGGSGTNDNNDSYSVTAIGIEKAEKIAYRVENVYMTSSSDYADARNFVIQAAKDLYGEGSQEEISVTDAMHAVGVGDAYGGDPGGYCASKGNDASYEWIAKVQIGSYSKSSGSASYSDFTSEVVTLSAGNSANITLTPGFASSTYNEYWKIWIDFNNNETFDSNELVYDSGSASSSAVNGTMNIPTGVNGYHRMRVSMKYNGAPTACESFSYGEVEDYTVNIITGGGDTQAPSAPTGLSSSNITETSFTLSWNASSDNVGVTGYDVYQNGSLLGSTTSTSGNITGLTAATTYTYYVKAKDAAGNVSNASNSISVTTSSGSGGSYCASKGNDASYEWIAKVQIGSFSKSSGSASYSDFTSETVPLNSGNSINIALTPGFGSGSYNEYWRIWIDYNDDGDFDDSNELAFDAGSVSSSTVSGTMNIPSGTNGTHRMRVSMKYNGASTPCESFSYGEVEDYTVNITTGSSADTEAPTAPTNLTASNITTTSFTVSWDASSDNVGVTGYDVYLDESLYGTTSSTSYNFAGLTPGTTYTVDVRAKDAANNFSAFASNNTVTQDEGGSSYCDSKGNDASYEWIAKVQIGSFSNSSGGASYTDYTSETVPVSSGTSVTLTPGFSSGSYNEYWRIWIDFNDDGDFDDSGELAYDSGSAKSSAVSGTMTIPSGVEGYHRMRVSMKYDGAPSPCETFSYGEVEDYTANITGGGGSEPVTYCESKGNDASYEWIAKVQVGSFSNSSGGQSYSDFTSKNVPISGNSVNVTLTPGFSGSTYNEYWRIWIDFNDDGDFDDSGELAFDAGSLSKNAVSGTMNIPSGSNGSHRMRVTMKYNGAPSPCETFSYGEVEDYTVTIANTFNILGNETIDTEEIESITLYPNPVKDELNIIIPFENANVKIISTTGAIVKVIQFSERENIISVSDLPAGIYTVYVENENENIVDRFIKQ